MEAGRVRTGILAGIAAIVGVVVLGGYLLSKSVTTRLAGLCSTMRAMGRDKDLTMRVSPGGKDEIAAVGDSFNELVKTLRVLLGELNGSVTTHDRTAAASSNRRFAKCRRSRSR